MHQRIGIVRQDVRGAEESAASRSSASVLQSLAGNAAVAAALAAARQDAPGLLVVQRRPWRPRGPAAGGPASLTADHVDPQRRWVYSPVSGTLTESDDVDGPSAAGRLVEQVEPGSDRHVALLTEIAEDTVPARFLDELVGVTDLSRWSADHEGLANAHHKFPKSALAWVFEHLAPDAQAALRAALFLPPASQAGALARLRSLLIAPVAADGAVVTSDNRLDDAHNNRAAAVPGEEGLDLLHEPSGALTPRSRRAFDLAGEARGIYARWRALAVARPGTPFVIDAATSARILDHLVQAERLHHAIEPRPELPSHASGDAWEAVGTRFRKRPVAVVVPALDLAANHARIRAEMRAAQDPRRQIAERWVTWLRSEPKSVEESDLKSDLNGRRAAIVRYVHGPRRGQAVPGYPRDPEWQQKVVEFAKGTRDPATIEDLLDAIFRS